MSEKTTSAEMPEPPAFLDRRPDRPSAAFGYGDVDDGTVMGIVPADRHRHVVDMVDPKDVRALISEGLGGGKRQYGIADAVLALFAKKRWHVIREG